MGNCWTSTEKSSTSNNTYNNNILPQLSNNSNNNNNNYHSSSSDNSIPTQQQQQNEKNETKYSARPVAEANPEKGETKNKLDEPPAAQMMIVISAQVSETSQNKNSNNTNIFSQEYSGSPILVRVSSGSASSFCAINPSPTMKSSSATARSTATAARDKMIENVSNVNACRENNDDDKELNTMMTIMNRNKNYYHTIDLTNISSDTNNNNNNNSCNCNDEGASGGVLMMIMTPPATMPDGDNGRSLLNRANHVGSVASSSFPTTNVIKMTTYMPQHQQTQNNNDNNNNIKQNEKVIPHITSFSFGFADAESGGLVVVGMEGTSKKGNSGIATSQATSLFQNTNFIPGKKRNEDDDEEDEVEQDSTSNNIQQRTKSTSHSIRFGVAAKNSPSGGINHTETTTATENDKNSNTKTPTTTTTNTTETKNSNDNNNNNNNINNASIVIVSSSNNIISSSDDNNNNQDTGNSSNIRILRQDLQNMQAGIASSTQQSQNMLLYAPSSKYQNKINRRGTSVFGPQVSSCGNTVREETTSMNNNNKSEKSISPSFHHNNNDNNIYNPTSAMLSGNLINKSLSNALINNRNNDHDDGDDEETFEPEIKKNNNVDDNDDGNSAHAPCVLLLPHSIESEQMLQNNNNNSSMPSSTPQHQVPPSIGVVGIDNKLSCRDVESRFSPRETDDDNNNNENKKQKQQDVLHSNGNDDDEDEDEDEDAFLGPIGGAIGAALKEERRLQDFQRSLAIYAESQQQLQRSGRTPSSGAGSEKQDSTTNQRISCNDDNNSDQVRKIADWNAFLRNNDAAPLNETATFFAGRAVTGAIFCSGTANTILNSMNYHNTNNNNNNIPEISSIASDVSSFPSPPQQTGGITMNMSTHPNNSNNNSQNNNIFENNITRTFMSVSISSGHEYRLPGGVRIVRRANNNNRKQSQEE